MIKLNKDYIIKFDPMNLILYKIKDESKMKLEVVGYFGSFKSLANILLQKQLLSKDIKTLQEIIDNIESFKKDILQSIVELNPDTKPYKYKLETDKNK